MIRNLPFGELTPLQAYSRIARGQTCSFLLESAEGGATAARYSFIGAGPKFIFSAVGPNIEIEHCAKIDRISIEPIQFLRSHFSKFEIKHGRDLPPFLGGAVGYIGFDCVGWFERTLISDAAEAVLMFFDSVVVFDHQKEKARIVTLTGDAEGFRSDHAAERENERIASLLYGPGSANSEPEANWEKGIVNSNFEKPDFERSVREIKELIGRGECYQVVLSQRFERPTKAQPLHIYRNLRSMNPSPYMFLLQIGGKSIIGSSPETLVAVRGEDLRYRPIAGTRPRGTGASEDSRLAEEMCADPKEVAEHMMLVDLGRNDLGRVATFGSVSVDRLMAVEKFSHVQHLVSELSAKLEPQCDRFDVLASCFPAGTVSGAPKVKAVDLIRRLEPQPRGIYAGAVGYFDYGANMDTCIAIRTIVLENGIASVQAGAGIVADSIPVREFEETVNKAKAMFRAIDAAEGQSDVVLEYLIRRFDRGPTFDETEAEQILNALIAETNEDLLTSVFTAWDRKGIEENEIYLIARILRARCIRVISKHENVLDIVGTGGSKAKRFNVSTAAAFVVAGAGFPVAKHGNKAATSRSGSADVLTALGVRCVEPDATEHCLNEIGICFMFAPNHHRLSPTLAKVRRELGFPTIFNCVGPLCNPAGAQFQLIGAWSEDIAVKMAKALSRLGTKRAWVVHGCDGLDEITLSGNTFVTEVRGDEIRRFEIAPNNFGIQSFSSNSAAHESPESSAEKIQKILSEDCEDPEIRDLVLVNAAAAIGLVCDGINLQEAYALARESIKSGSALRKLRELSEATSA